jgi:hypothetical protein
MSKTIFDHLKGITKEKIPWDSLSDADKESWDDYMITRWLSMKPEYLQYVNDLQVYRYAGLSGCQYYELLRMTLPSEFTYFKYIKKPKITDAQKKLVAFFCFVYNISSRESLEIIELFRNLRLSDDFDELMNKYGIQLEEKIELRKELFNDKE